LQRPGERTGLERTAPVRVRCRVDPSRGAATSSVAKITELSVRSEKSFEDAVQVTFVLDD